MPVTFDFTATVSSVNPALAAFFSVGETLTGSYTFESTTPGVPPGPPVADYDGVTSFSIKGAAFAGSWSDGFIGVEDEATDEYLVETGSGFSGTDTRVGLFPPTGALALRDSTGMLLTNTLLPLTPPALPADATVGIDYLVAPETRDSVTATLVSLTLVPTPAPEPPTSILLIFAIPLIMLWRRAAHSGCAAHRGRR